MTTLDDAAERRVLELATSIAETICSGDQRIIVTDLVRSTVRAAWAAATEAAAKKCEATGNRPATAISESIVEAYNNACEDCAYAIRGKGR